jgi:hypothetical protein
MYNHLHLVFDQLLTRPTDQPQHAILISIINRNLIDPQLKFSKIITTDSHCWLNGQASVDSSPLVKNNSILCSTEIPQSHKIIENLPLSNHNIFSLFVKRNFTIFHAGCMIVNHLTHRKCFTKNFNI